MAGLVVGTITGFEHGQVRVRIGGSTVAVAARALAAIDDAALSHAAEERSEAVLLFEDGDPARPVVIGLLRSRTPLTDALLTGPLPTGEKVARLDGRRVVLEGRDEIVLRCGKSSLTLQRDGRVVLRGVNLVTQADQVHRIRGGKVQIN